MANPMKGETRLGDYTLAFNFGAFCSLEERTGKKMPELLQTMAGGLGFSELRDVVIVALAAHHPEATEEDVLTLLDAVGYQAAALAVSKAVGGFFGEQKVKDGRPTK